MIYNYNSNSIKCGDSNKFGDNSVQLQCILITAILLVLTSNEKRFCEKSDLKKNVNKGLLSEKVANRGMNEE